MGALLAAPAAAATTATTGALTTGLTAGSILGTGTATSGLLGGLGLNALGGMTSVLPAAAAAGPSLALPALATKGLTAAATPGIFAKAAPALGGLPAGTTIPTAFNAATPFANAASGLASVAPGATSFKSLAMANAPLTANPASWNAVNQFAGLGSQTGNLAPEMVKASQTVSSQLANQVPQQTPGLVENIRNANTAMRGPANMSYAQGAQGLSPNVAALPPASPIQPGGNFLSNLGNLIQNPSMDAAGDYIKEHPMATAAAGLGAYQLLKPKQKAPEQDVGSIRPYEFTRTQRPEAYAVSPLDDTSERMYFDSKFTPLEPYAATSPRAKEIEKIAGGGIASAYAVGGPVETMSAMNAIGGNMQYPQAGLQTALYSNPMVQRPEAVNVVSPGEGPAVGAYSGEQRFAEGGISDLGGYSDGGRLLRGPGDGVSDSIPAVIGKRQPARLADGEFVIPARIVSELGNGSTEAGARKLYAMMERVQNTRKKSIGKKKVAVNSKADKHLPA